jgi:hypothetical protein
MLTSRLATAEEELRGSCQALVAMGEQAYRASFAAMLADAAYSGGRPDEAQHLTN